MVTQAIQEAFADRPAILQGISSLIAADPRAQQVFAEVALYVNELRERARTTTTASTVVDRTSTQIPNRSAPEEPSVKKRKLNGAAGGDSEHAVANGAATTDFLTATWPAPTIDVSFTVPQRKRYSLQISPDAGHGIRALNVASKAGEFGVPWSSVEHVLRLPVPDKATAAHNFCVFPRGGDGLSNDGSGAAGDAGFETMVWTAGAATKRGEEDAPTESDLIQRVLTVAKVATIVEPSEDEFVSVARNPMRKTEKQYHVKAHKGSKEGYLFFLSTGIAFVFKKPLQFFAFSAIHSISYTSVLQRTFNLNISAVPASSKTGDPIEFEFSMLDQADFPGIDEYIKRHELNDASMAETRKAKKYNVNKDQPPDGGEGEEGEEGESIIKQAEKEAGGAVDDEDDEDDENFDPGSEGESEGEVSSSDEEEDGGGGGGGDGDDDNAAMEEE